MLLLGTYSGSEDPHSTSGNVTTYQEWVLTILPYEGRSKGKENKGVGGREGCGDDREAVNGKVQDEIIRWEREE